MRSRHNRVALTSSVASAATLQALSAGLVGMRALHDGVEGAAFKLFVLFTQGLSTLRTAGIGSQREACLLDRLAVQEISQVLLGVDFLSLFLAGRGLGGGLHSALDHFTFILLTSDNMLLITDKVDLAVLIVLNICRVNDGDRDADVEVSEIFTDELVQGISVHELVGYGTHADGDGVE